jgi:ATP-binding cassette, subfamily B, bacterial
VPLVAKTRSGIAALFSNLRSIGRVFAVAARLSRAALLLKFVGMAIDSIVPLLTAYLAAQTATLLVEVYRGDTAALAQAEWYVVATGAVALLQIVWRQIEEYQREWIRLKVETGIGSLLYGKFLELDFALYDDAEVIDLKEKAERFSNLFGYIYDRLFGMVGQLISMVAAVLALSFVNVYISLAVLIAVLPTVILQFVQNRRNVAIWNNNQTDRRRAYYIEHALLSPDYTRTLRTLGLGERMLNMRQQYRNKDTVERLAIKRKYMPLEFLADALRPVVEVAVLLWSVWAIAQRLMPIGQYIFLQQAVGRALGSATSFTVALASISEDLSYLRDYDAFMALPTSKQRPVKLVSGDNASIDFNNVSFRYPKGHEDVLRQVSLAIKPGSHVAIVGENGAGKSTMVALLLGYYTPTSGNITVDGKDLAEMDLNSWHERVSLLTQDTTLFEFLSVRDNVLFGDIAARNNGGRYDGALRDSMSKEFVDALEAKDQTYINKYMASDGEKATELSGGQLQRLSIARALYHDT